MPRTISALALLTPAALAACPSKPPPASLIADDASVPSVDSPVDAPGEDADNVIELGFPDPLPGTRPVDNNDLIAFPFQVASSQAGELVGWGVKSAFGPMGTQVRMAIYSNSGTANQPATKLTESGTWSLANGVLLSSGFLLDPGDYWLLVSVNNSISIGKSTSTPMESRECFGTLLFMTAFPDAWSGNCFEANPINIFIRIRPSP